LHYNSTILFKKRTSKIAKETIGIGGLADKMGVSSPSVTQTLRIEDGPSPTLNKVDEIAAALGAPPWELIKPDDIGLNPRQLEITSLLHGLNDADCALVLALIKRLLSGD
jgi:transcriptional regulator with XRE-family HTH domain